MLSEIKNLFLAASLMLMSLNAQAQSLAEIYKASVANTATIKTRALAEEIAEEQKTQAIAGVIPQISINSNNVWRDRADVGPFGEAYQHSAFVALTQPLFQGGAQYYAVKIAKSLPDIAKFEREQEELALYAMVAQAFYQSLSLQRVRDVYLEQEKTLRDRVRTLKSRAKIGRNKKTDVIAAQSQLARITADRSRVERQRIEAIRNLKNLSGLEKVGDLTEVTSLDQLQVPPLWEVNLLKTPQVAANELLVQNAKREIGIAQGTYLPSVDLGANYYLDRAGILRESEWDITVNAKWDIYTGGRDSSEVRIQKLQVTQLEAQLTDIKRNLTNNFKSLRDEFFMHKKIIEQLDDAVKLAKENYERHLREADQGLVNDLDVLQVLENYLQVRSTYDQQLYEAKMAWVQLRALAGEHP